MDMPFGPHQGKPVVELPSRYLEWILTDVNPNDWPQLVEAAKEELKYRNRPAREFEVLL